MINVSKRRSASDIDSALVLFAESDIGRAFVDPYSKSFKLGFDDSLVRQRLNHI